MSDFLTQFKKLQPITIAKSGKTMTGKEIFFMIRTGENDTFIIPVDKKLKPVEADYHYYSGDTAQLPAQHRQHQGGDGFPNLLGRERSYRREPQPEPSLALPAHPLQEPHR